MRSDHGSDHGSARHRRAAYPMRRAAPARRAPRVERAETRRACALGTARGRRLRGRARHDAPGFSGGAALCRSRLNWQRSRHHATGSAGAGRGTAFGHTSRTFLLVPRILADTIGAGAVQLSVAPAGPQQYRACRGSPAELSAGRGAIAADAVSASARRLPSASGCGARGRHARAPHECGDTDSGSTTGVRGTGPGGSDSVARSG